MAASVRVVAAQPSPSGGVRDGTRASQDGRGLSNAEAATALFVTNKTVEYHLSNIYTKLGVKSRRELTAVLTT